MMTGGHESWSTSWCVKRPWAGRRKTFCRFNMPVEISSPMNVGNRPVGCNWASGLVPSSNRNKSRISSLPVIGLMPATSVIWLRQRRPSRIRLSCTITSMAEAIWWWIESTGRSAAISTSTSSRWITSFELLAWTVVIEPSWPVFMACSMSSASGPRHSPTTMRSGRMRRAFFTRSRIVYSPAPSMLAALVSSVTTCSLASCSSVVSSIVTIRSLSGMKSLRQLSSVVLPVPVPPVTRMFLRPSTAARRNSAAVRVIAPLAIRSSTSASARETCGS